MMQDRFGTTEHQEKFMRSLPKGWEQDNWRNDDAPTGAAIALALVCGLGWVVLWVWWKLAS